uniref:Uncharacterized protein n=1 Tax=Meloidogyne enterolobii TaxID=390850 RepID=A0A6V7Y2S8_MELEN|nr:unnamed protein product [Meloidogyne enterolobii]
MSKFIFVFILLIFIFINSSYSTGKEPTTIDSRKEEERKKMKENKAAYFDEIRKQAAEAEKKRATKPYAPKI